MLFGHLASRFSTHPENLATEAARAHVRRHFLRMLERTAIGEIGRRVTRAYGCPACPQS